jgi:rSAM/selenodomain-associated transferase 2
MKLDIIIPTLNEAAYIGSTLDNLFARAADISRISVLISDCASSDATLSEAQKFQVHVPDYKRPPTSRSEAMNFGADYLSGEALLFLHADALVPYHFDQLIIDTLSRPGTVGGAFEFTMDDKGLSLKLLELFNRIRYRMTHIYFGDQAIFASRAAFLQVGKFPDVHLMEDAKFCRQLKKIGRTTLVKEKMISSNRRFTEGGILRVLLFDSWCTILNALGFSIERYAASYKKNNSLRGTNYE